MLVDSHKAWSKYTIMSNYAYPYYEYPFAKHRYVKYYVWMHVVQQTVPTSKGSNNVLLGVLMGADISPEFHICQLSSAVNCKK